MSDIPPAEKEWTIQGGLAEAGSAVVAALQSLKGTIVRSTGTYMECDFGSLLVSRLIGEFWVSKGVLPKRAEITLEPIGEDATRVKLLIRDRHKFGFKIGVRGKYEQSLQEMAQAIYDRCRPA